jgi:glycosyltransferase involved in cell wall biosynthesis
VPTSPVVSVIIPVYNGEAFIEEALESVFAQTYRDFEVIVVNDGSTDATEQRLVKYQGRINYVRQENQGQSASRHEGLTLAKGSLIAFLDADDAWLPRKLERQVGFSQVRPEYGIVTTDALSFRGEEVVTRSIKDWCDVPNGNVVEKLLFANWIVPSAAMVRKECFEKVALYPSQPPEYGEDWLMWMQIAAYYPVYFIDEVLVRRRLHPGSVSSQGAEAWFSCLIRNLEIVRERIPQLKARPRLVDEAAFRVCYNRGLNDLRAVELARAREKLRLALRYKPRAVKTWAGLIAAHTPEWAVRGLKKIVKKARQLRPAAHP